MRTVRPRYIDGIKQEQNRFKRAFIWVWYSSLFRMLCLSIALPFMILLSVFLRRIGLDIDAATYIAYSAYITLIFMFLIFRDYSNLRRIGLDEYRNRLKDGLNKQNPIHGRTNDTQG